jgi:hypothetical protein
LRKVGRRVHYEVTKARSNLCATADNSPLATGNSGFYQSRKSVFTTENTEGTETDGGERDGTRRGMMRAIDGLYTGGGIGEIAANM